MAKPFDSALKELIERHPIDWLTLAGGPAGATVQVIDTDVSTVSAAADKIIRIETTAAYLLHIELESSPRTDPGEYLQWYNTLIRHRHGLPVQTLVVLLRPSADSPRWDGLYQHRLPNEAVYMEFRYRVVRLWEQSVGSFLNAGLGLLPLAMLTNVPEIELPVVAERIAERLQREAAPTELRTLWQTTFILTGLRLPPQAMLALFQGVTSMGNILEDSSAYQIFKEAGLRDGLREGRVEGLREGRVEGLRDVVLGLGHARFGAAAPDILQSLKQVADPERLKRMIQRLHQVASWDELLTTP
ncbi:MAG: Rpn family recombination-promoting nuclease/putative transposase [Planctomycetia bacterium]|nr:Rpn family recombination-promoting nuclease/putative transposase [Planctomycetia bacterium]